jgi:multidrug efflux pump
VTLAEACIRRPVLAIVLSVAIVLFGVVAFFSLGVREYPAVDAPVVTVTTIYNGANPEVVDAQITEPIEQALAGIAGVKNIFSTSREATSSIRVEFELSVDIDDAANDVRDKVAGAVRRLPADADPPIVEKADADSDPIVFMTVRSDTASILDVSHVANTRIKDRIQTIPGVSSVRIFGEKRYSMRVWLDADKMSAHAVTPEDVRSRLGAWNVDLPSGRVEGEQMEVAVRTEGRLEKPEQFSRILLRENAGHMVRLEDVGTAELGPLNARWGVKRLGQNVIGVAVIPQPNTNAIAIADEFYERFKEIERDMPAEYEVEIGYDFTRYVRKSVKEVEETLLIAFVLVALVIYLFLRDFRAAIVPVVAIPVSIVATFVLVKAFGFSINVLTLVGIVLSIGLVCDDAIVVLETIYSKIERGMRPLEAAIAGANEIFFAIVSTTVTLAVVFMPIVFVSGLTGRLFREFAVVVVGSVLISGFVALTLSPMMCRYLLREAGQLSLFYRLTEPLFLGLTRGYRWLLVGFMKMRFVAPAVLVLVVVWSYRLYQRIPTELAPLEDRSNIRINIRGPEGAKYGYTERQLDAMAAFVKDSVPETSRTYSIIGGFGGTGGPNVGIQNIYLTEREERTRSQEEIYKELSRSMGRFDGVAAFPTQPPTIGSRFAGQPVQLVLQAPSLRELTDVLPKVMEKVRARPELRFVDVDLRFNRPQLSLEVDRERAGELGLSALDVGRSLQLALGGVRYGYFIMDGKQYEIIGQLKESDRDDPQDLDRLYIRSQRGEMIPLSGREESGDGRPCCALPQRPRRGRDDLRRSRRRQDVGGGDRRHAGGGGGSAPRRFLDGAHGAVARLRRGVFVDLARLRLRDRPHLPRARGALRELPRPPRDLDDRPAVARRGARVARLHPAVAERVQPHRDHHAGRPGDEERHPRRRVRQPQAPRGRLPDRRVRRRRRRALSSRAHDELGDHPRRPPHRALPRWGCREPEVPRDRRGRRIELLVGADALPRPGDARAHRPTRP